MRSFGIGQAFREFAAREYLAGRIDRRLFLGVLSGAIAVPMLSMRGVAYADTKEFVMSTFGGRLAEALKTEYAGPFTAANGLTLKEDPSGPLAGRIRAMVEAKQVIWDVCDSVSFTAIALGKAGLLEPIDYAIVDKSNITPDCALEHGVNYGWYSVGVAYDKSKFGDKPPQTWADVFNTKDYPGKRAFWKYGYCWEGALLADGVAPDKLYPLDVDRAVASSTRSSPIRSTLTHPKTRFEMARRRLRCSFLMEQHGLQSRRRAGSASRGRRDSRDPRPLSFPKGTRPARIWR